jgi:hypothetical protein
VGALACGRTEPTGMLALPVGRILDGRLPAVAATKMTDSENFDGNCLWVRLSEAEFLVKNYECFVHLVLGHHQR